VITHHETQVGSARIHWVEAGEGTEAPFLLVHGWGSSVLKWMDAIPLLAGHRRTIAIDLPGFGESSTPRGSYSPAWLAGSIQAFMNAIDVERAIVVGNSLGGLIAIHFAAAWPQRVEALIGVAPALPNDGPQPPMRNMAAVLAPTVPVLGEALFGRHVRRDPEAIVRESLVRNCVDPQRVSATTRAALVEEARARASRPEQVKSVTLANRRMMWALSGGREATWRIARLIKAPTLFLWGEGDRMVPAHIGDRAVREVPGAQLIVLKDTGHNPQMETPQEFASATIAFSRAVAAKTR
jgi:pimeloyl-ACP methyl ester carboxylesterase